MQQQQQQQQPRRRGTLVALATLLLALASATAAAAAPPDPRIAQLQELEAAARDKLITFNEAQFNEFALSADRPYHLVFFGSAKRYMDNSKLQLSKLKKEFVYAAQAFKSGPDAARVFFVDMWYDDAGPVFSRLGLQSVPAVFHWGPERGGKPGKKLSLPESAKCGAGISKYPWPAEDIAEFVKSRTSLTAGAIDRPSFIKSPLFPLAALAFLFLGGAAAWRLYNSPIVRVTWLWALGALAVYAFSTSGGMYTIIRGMPMYINRGGKIQWWLEGRQGQLGAEGLVMGGSYVIFSSCISLMVYGLPHVKNAHARSGLSVAAAVAAAVIGRSIFAAWFSKTGMHMRSFF